MMWAANDSDGDREKLRGVVEEQVPIGRIADASEAAAAAIWLLNNAAS